MVNAKVEQRESPITPEGRDKLLQALNMIEQRSEKTLGVALTNMGVGDGDPARDLYKNLSQEGIKKPLSVKAILKNIGEIAWGNFWGKVTTISLTTGTALGIIREAALNWDSFRILYNNAIAWSFTSVAKGTDPLVALSTASTAAIVLAVPTLAVATVTNINQRHTEQLINRMNRINATRNAIEAGEANLNYLVGPNVHILVGKSDPSAQTLITMFNDIGVKVITFWDESTAIPPNKDHFWLKTKNMWTRADLLNKASLDNTLCMFSEVSKGSDVFLSRRSGTFSRLYEDMSDAESRNANTKANYLLKQKGITRTIPLVAVTNIKREIVGSVAGETEAIYGTKTEGDLYAKNKHMHARHADGIVTKIIAQISDKSGFPVELMTDSHRQQEYERSFSLVISDHNEGQRQKVKKQANKPELRYKTAEDGRKTLTCFYGEDDQATLKLLEGFLEETSEEGDVLAIINDPEVIGELPEEIRTSKRYICIGEVLAKDQFKQFVQLVDNGDIILPAEIQSNLDTYRTMPQLFSIEHHYGTFKLD